MPSPPIHTLPTAGDSTFETLQKLLLLLNQGLPATLVVPLAALANNTVSALDFSNVSPTFGATVTGGLIVRTPSGAYVDNAIEIDGNGSGGYPALNVKSNGKNFTFGNGHGMGFQDYAAGYIATSASVTTADPDTITISQEKGAQSQQHRRIFFTGASHEITAYGWTESAGGDDVREGPIGWHIKASGVVGLGTKTPFDSTPFAQVTFGGAIGGFALQNRDDATKFWGMYSQGHTLFIRDQDNQGFNIGQNNGTYTFLPVAANVWPLGSAANRFATAWLNGINTVTSTPASASAAGAAGTWAWDASYIYMCVATNTWKRVAIATW